MADIGDKNLVAVAITSNTRPKNHRTIRLDGTRSYWTDVFSLAGCQTPVIISIQSPCK